jgi:hypothetical protein
VVIGTASARPRGTIVRSGWNCPGEPTPTAPLLISANPGPLAADGGRPLPDLPGSGRRAASGQNRRTVLAVPSFSPGVNKVVPNVVSSALAAAPVRVRTIPLIRT